MPVDTQRFRSLMGAFPTGVIIVTTVDPDGAPKGLTTQSFLSVSTDPPLLVVSLDKTSRTLRALLATRAFAVNFLASGRGDLATRFATKSDDKFSGVEWQPASAANGSPILASSPARSAAAWFLSSPDFAITPIFAAFLARDHPRPDHPSKPVGRRIA